MILRSYPKQKRVIIYVLLYQKMEDLLINNAPRSQTAQLLCITRNQGNWLHTTPAINQGKLSRGRKRFDPGLPSGSDGQKS